MSGIIEKGARTMREQAYKKAEEVQKVLNENGVYADVYPHGELPVVQVEIRWGDWKHDHLRADWLIGENVQGLSKLGEQITEEDGSDTYSAIHNFIIIE